MPIVQTFLNDELRAGQSVRNVQILRQILSAALSRAEREELVPRNVARLVELPTWEPGTIVPWSSGKPSPSSPPPPTIRSIPRSSSCYYTGCTAVKCSVCAGRTSTPVAR